MLNVSELFPTGYDAYDESSFIDLTNRREQAEWNESWNAGGYNRDGLEQALGRRIDPDEDVERMHRVIADTFEGENGLGYTYPSESYEELAVRFHALVLDKNGMEQ